jgi:hypothetical protein
MSGQLRTSVLPSSLSRGFESKYLYTMAREQINTIDVLIKQAHAAGMDRVKYNLPTTVPATSMVPADAQLILYTQIVRAYDEAGYLVEVNPKTHDLIIKWSNNLTEDDRSKLTEYLSTFRTG